MTKGLIHVYTGEGKGKTTAAFGLAKRAAGHGRNVLILQFLKSRTKDSGEIISSEKTGIKVVKFEDQTTPLFDPEVKLPELKNSIKKAVTFSIKEIKSGIYDLVILDEFNTVLGCNYASMKDAEKIIKAKPDRLELIFTGRGAPEELIEIADYVTEMRMIKHPFQKGVKARKGIEF
ncbi:MAG TPA: cob(I)yrinic acid a,c-diamide adenosyltransferase [Nitrospirae bacterium]|nr:cob(I)yrinic acid a,c-diamide adenosyltransferase [bacterium BMS3Abin06]HDH12291.1 cob(I)yrinic acid a,c-diamide adenosyltransferase [Nitrospirota bacterium]HDZ00798.1 cob(I)yrinic acid a,c-diamide adenosyltransferase [Nitrospirota bacterium]